MGERWRWLDLDRQGPYENAATMPVLVRSVATSGEPIAQTSVWGRTHLNVGWFDDVDATLDLAECDRLGLDVVRRYFYGGGTAYYERECSMLWGFLLPQEYVAERGGLDPALRRFQPVVLDALDRVGLGAVRFEGSSDLRWRGRKLGALTAQDVVSCGSVGGFVNLRRPDLATYLQVVRVPEDKFKDKVVKDMASYVCSAEDVTGAPVAYEALRDALVAALADAGIDLVSSELSDGERKGVAKGSTRVGSPDVVRRISGDRFVAAAPAGSRVGFANHKGRKLCRAGVAVDARGVIVAALMAGDMHVSPPDVLDRVADALVGVPAADVTKLRRRIAAVFDDDQVSQADDTLGVSTDDLLAAVTKAVTKAVPHASAGRTEVVG
ncbi:MAG: lipoate--protein ligase family protein [Acidimicrobiales bacterium]